MLRSVDRLLHAHLHAARTAYHQLKYALLSNLLIICVISIALVLPTCFKVLTYNVKRLTGSWHATMPISVFIDKRMTHEQVQELVDQVRQDSDVAYANYISPKQGLMLLEEQTGIGELTTLFKENPLPSVIEVHPAAVVKQRVQALQQRLQRLKGAERVTFDMQWLLRLDSLLRFSEKIHAALTALFGLAVLLIIGNTLRLAVVNRYDEVEVLKLMGATNGFIRLPFLYMGIFYGLLGACLAWLTMMLLVRWLQMSVEQLSALYYTHFELSYLPFSQGLELVLLGVLLGGLGAYASVSAQIRRFDCQ